jgi:hypothetical protein
MEYDIIVSIISWAAQSQYGAYVLAFLGVVGGIVTTASFIVPLTKTPKDDEVVGKVKAFLLRVSVTKPKE